MKLTEEEIKEYQNDNYQMMAAIAGKPVSELMGESTSRPNFKHNYCLIKQMYLKNCIVPITSKELYQTLQKQGYNAKCTTFRGLLNNYMKYGYIQKTTLKKPFLYTLTDLGKAHAKDPFLLVDENARRYKEFQLNKLKQIIEEYPEIFKQIYETIFGSQPVLNSVVTSSGGNISPERIEEIKHDLEYQIFTPDFWKNTDTDKLSSLLDGILNPLLPEEERKQLLIDAFEEALKVDKGKMIINQQQYNPSKPTGIRRYYTPMIRAIGEIITKSTYESFPFRFIKVGN